MGRLDPGTKDEKIYLARVLAASGDQSSIPYLDKVSRDNGQDVAQEGLRALRSLRARLRSLKAGITWLSSVSADRRGLCSVRLRVVESLMIVASHGVGEESVHIRVLRKHGHQRVALVAGGAERPEPFDIRDCHTNPS